jgi:hypothetical protein
VPVETYGDHYAEHLFEQYKAYVESAHHVTDRRAGANSYFLAVSTSLVTLYGLATALNSTAWRILIAIAGVLVAIIWHTLILSYRNLNTVKFAVIHELETHLPANLYSYEWQIMERGKKRLYTPLSHIERWIPIVFLSVYIVLGAHAIFSSPPAAATPSQAFDQLQRAAPRARPLSTPGEKK